MAGTFPGSAVKIRPFDPADVDDVVGLWQECGLVVPWNDPFEDVRRKSGVQPELGCPKVNLQVRTANRRVVEFYRRIGYTVDDVVSLGKRLIDK